ncbi:IS3 family transposase, partial [Enterococcus florum]|uniref:IS3 family transposase n=1 Tax=Enterococcus florum TaxID=2480627 RepID=UPI0011BA7E6B
KKSKGIGKEESLGQFRNVVAYQAIKFMHEEKGYPIKPMCDFLQVARSAYYRWVKQPVSVREQTNRHIAEVIRTIHDQHPDMGYRRIKDELKRTCQLNVNDKR